MNNNTNLLSRLVHLLREGASIYDGEVSIICDVLDPKGKAVAIVFIEEESRKEFFSYLGLSKAMGKISNLNPLDYASVAVERSIAENAVISWVDNHDLQNKEDVV